MGFACQYIHSIPLQQTHPGKKKCKKYAFTLSFTSPPSLGATADSAVSDGPEIRSSAPNRVFLRQTLRLSGCPPRPLGSACPSTRSSEWRMGARWTAADADADGRESEPMSTAVTPKGVSHSMPQRFHGSHPHQFSHGIQVVVYQSRRWFTADWAEFASQGTHYHYSADRARVNYSKCSAEFRFCAPNHGTDRPSPVWSTNRRVLHRAM